MKIKRRNKFRSWSRIVGDQSPEAAVDWMNMKVQGSQVIVKRTLPSSAPLSVFIDALWTIVQVWTMKVYYHRGSIFYQEVYYKL